MRISSGIHQKTGSLQILSEKISCRHRREDTFHGYSHVAGVEMWACHQIDFVPSPGPELPIPPV